MNEEKTKVFEKELSYINNPRYKEGAQKLISLLPDYFLKFQHLQQESIILVLH